MVVPCNSKAHAESKVDDLEDQLRRLRTQVEELSRLNADFNNLKARITQENFELHRQVQDLDSSNAALSKAKSQLQAQLDETKARLDEETRVRPPLPRHFLHFCLSFFVGVDASLCIESDIELAEGVVDAMLAMRCLGNNFWLLEPSLTFGLPRGVVPIPPKVFSMSHFLHLE